MEVTNQNLIQFSDDVRDSPCPHILDTLMDFPTFLDELLSAGFPLHSELTVPAFGTVVCKAQEVEGFWLSLSGFAPMFFRISPEFYQPAFLLLQLQSKVSHSAFWAS